MPIFFLLSTEQLMYFFLSFKIVFISSLFFCFIFKIIHVHLKKLMSTRGYKVKTSELASQPVVGSQTLQCCVYAGRPSWSGGTSHCSVSRGVVSLSSAGKRCFRRCLFFSFISHFGRVPLVFLFFGTSFRVLPWLRYFPRIYCLNVYNCKSHSFSQGSRVKLYETHDPEQSGARPCRLRGEREADRGEHGEPARGLFSLRLSYCSVSVQSLVPAQALLIRSVE